MLHCPLTLVCALVLLALGTQPAHANNTALLLGDAFQPPSLGQATRASGTLPARYSPSAFLAGKIAVRLVFVESDGSIQPSTEDWTDSQRIVIEQHVHAALDWWAARVPNARVSFQVVAQTATIGSEPITLGLNDESRWAGSAFTALGIPGTNHFEQAYSADEALRQEYHSDWATTIFVVNSASDSDGRFADGHFAYAYVGGPFIVVTSDAGVYGVEKFAPILSHELGHVFGALDQYESAQTPCSAPGGYLAVPTTNSQSGGCGSAFICVMWEPLAGYQANAVDASALGQVGYRDSDGDSIPDPLDTAPILTVNLSEQSGKLPLLSAHAIDQPYVSSTQRSISVNTIQQIAYRVDGSEWYVLPASDGAFDSTDERVTASLPLYDGNHTVEFRATNQVGATSPIISQTVRVTGVGTAPSYSITTAADQNTAAPVIALTAPPGFSVRISATAAFSDTTWQAIQPSVTAPGTWAEGVHTLYIGLRDANNIETPISQRTVLIDRTAPTGSAALIEQGQTALQTVGIDQGSGIASMQLLVADNRAIDWQPFVPALTLTSGSAPRAILLRDVAGNISAPIPVTQRQQVLLPLIHS